MTTLDQLSASFQAISVPVAPRVLEKCLELCQIYRIDAEDFVDQWFAFAASQSITTPPSLADLEELERKEIQNQVKKFEVKTPKRYDKPIETTPRTPVRQPEIVESSAGIPNNEKTPSQRYGQRSDARSVQCEYGECSSVSFKETSASAVVVKLKNWDSSEIRYMYERLGARQEVINHLTRWIGGQILKHHQLTLTEEPLKSYSGEVVVCGRIYSDSTKLNLQSLLFEGALETHKGHTVQLNVGNLEKLALFSGQVVVVEGNNTKDSLVANRIYTGGPLPFPEDPVSETPLQVVVAAGPFTLPDNLMYEPLSDFLTYVAETKPDLLILIGPFIDKTHTLIEEMTEGYDEFFETLLNDLTMRLDGIKTVLIPSHSDIHNHVIYPTPPYRTQKLFPNITFAPDPCLIDVNGVVIGATSTDVLFQLNKQELFVDKNLRSDRMARMASHLLNQRSFYPLHPPDSDVRLDLQLLETLAMLESSPHLLVLPSNFRHFIKKVDGCVVVNPERLTKGNVAGTFARIEVRPGNGPICDRLLGQVLRV